MSIVGESAKVGAVAAIATGVGIKGGLAVAGFTSTGVAAGSLAAGIQAAIGSVAAGSGFAIATSVAMGGALAVFWPSLIVGGVFAIAALGYFAWKKYFK